MQNDDNRIYEYVVDIRRQIHRYPETGFDLPRTCSLVTEELESLGIAVDTGFGENSIVAEIQGGRPGKTIALRADMDALPLQEESGLEFASALPGKMHACGHDGHTAMLLGAAKLLLERKDELSGRVRLIFQPSEEGPISGARVMTRAGAAEGVDRIFAFHLTTEIETGMIAANPGRALAAASTFDIEIHGRGGHAGAPHTTIDAVALGIQAANAMQYIVSRETDPFEPAVISIGSVHGGSAGNIISERLRMSGTIRTFDSDIQDRIKERIRSILDGIVNGAGGTYSVVFNDGLPPLINDAESVEIALNSAAKRVGDEHCIVLQKGKMGSEDFVYFLQEIPGCILWLGAGNKAEGHIYPLHHPKFSFDERALLIGIRVYEQLVTDQLS